MSSVNDLFELLDTTDIFFDFNSILAYRHKIDTEHSVDDDVAVLTFRDFRTRYIELNNSNSFEKALEGVTCVYYELWKFLSSLPNTHPLYLPPLYQDNSMISSVLHNFIRQTLVRSRTAATITTGNMILGGVEGAGKTTLARAMCIGVGILSPNYIMMYYDYKKSVDIIPMASQLIAELIFRIQQHNFEGTFGQLSDDENFIKFKQRVDLKKGISILKSRFGLSCGMIADEVQSLIDIIHQGNMVGPKCLLSIEELGRVFGGFLILTGSSAHIHIMLFKHLRGELYASCPDFNGTLCQFYHVPALRNAVELRKYLEVRYPNHHINDHLVNNMLYMTGGIGRYVNDMFAVGLPMAALPARIQVNCTNDLFRVESHMAIITTLIYIANYSQVNQLRCLWSLNDMSKMILDECFGVPKLQLETAYREMGLRNFDEVIFKLVQGGILYLNLSRYDQDNEKNMEFVEIAIPKLCESLYFRTSSDPNDFLHLLCSVLMIYFDSLQNNAGKPLEAYIRNRLHKLDCTCFKSCKSTCHIYFHADGIYIKHNDGDCAQRVTSINDLVDKLFSWSNEIGVDGFEVQFNDSTNTGTVNVWQCKGGARINSINGGNVETYRAHFVKDGKVKSIDDEYLAGILAKAEVGLIAIVDALTKAFPSIIWQCGVVVVTTTKTGRNGENMLSRTKRFTLQQDMVQKFNQTYSSTFVMTPGKELSYCVEFLYGTKWFEDIVDKKHRCFLPVVDLSRRMEETKLNK